MNNKAKRLRRFTQGAHDFTWQELVAVLASLGFAETSDSGGSRRTFVSPQGQKIHLHRPHPDNIVKRYMMKQVIAALRSYGVAIKEHT
jgi:hypothetical protein